MEEEIIKTPVQPLPQEVVPETPKKNSLKTVLLVFLGLFVIAGAVYAGIKIGRKQILPNVATQPTVTPQTTEVSPTPDETANWKTYRNEKYKYSLKYPDNWFLQEKIDLVAIYNHDPSTHKFEVVAINTTTYDYPVEDFIFNIDIYNSTTENQPKLSQQDSIIIEGIQGLKGILVGGQGEKILMASIVKNEKRYNFYGRSANSVDKSYFDQILSTFKFLK